MDSWILQNIDINSLTSTSLFNVMSLFDVLEIYIYIYREMCGSKYTDLDALNETK